MWSGSFATRENTGDPQREQKHRLAPGEDSYSDIKSSPEITRYRSSGIRALAEKLCRWRVGIDRSDKVEPRR